jgi:pseudouridine kinase
MAKLYVIGGAATDIIGRPQQALILGDSNPAHIAIGFGGVGYNIAHNAIQMGGEVVFFTRFGRDVLGQLHHQRCRDLGLDVSFAEWADTRSATYVAVLDAQGDLHSAVADVDIVDDLSLASLKPLLASMQAEDLCVLEANLSAVLLNEVVKHIPARIAFEPISTIKAQKAHTLFKHIDIFKPNRLEAESLLKRSLDSPAAMKDALKQFQAWGVAEVLISDGAKGLYAAGAEGDFHAQGRALEALNATGAGDAFFGVYVSQRANQVGMREACALGMAASALTLQSEATVRSDLSLDRLHAYLLQDPIRFEAL